MSSGHLLLKYNYKDIEKPQNTISAEDITNLAGRNKKLDEAFYEREKRRAKISIEVKPGD